MPSLLINATSAPSSVAPVGTSRIEHPGNDARGFSLDAAYLPDVETHLVNAVLTNGARYYVDHAHPEISTPEARCGRGGPLPDRAAEEIVRRSMTAAGNVLGNDAEVVVYKNNSDGKGNSYGCHENYLRPRRHRSVGSPPRSRLTSSPGRSSAVPARSAASSPVSVATTRCPTSCRSGPISSRRKSGSRRP